MSFKNSTLNFQDPKQIIIDYQKLEKHLILNGKNQRSNNTLFINYAPKFLIKNTGPNINNINYINNININNEYINLGDKKKKIQKNTKSGLNFNYVYNINNVKENNKYKLKKSLISRGNSINSLNYEYVIDNIKNLNINNKKKSFNTSQNIIQNDNPKPKKADKSLKEKFKTHLILDMNYNSENSNRIILKTEHNPKKSTSKYDNLDNRKNFKINLGNKNNIKLLKAKINSNKQNQRKFEINFKNAINKKIISERVNDFIKKDNNNNNSNRYKSLNTKEYIINNNSKQKSNINNNENKSKNQNKNIVYNYKNIENKSNLFQKILKENNNTNFKNVAIIKSKLPKLKVNKTGLNFK